MQYRLSTLAALTVLCATVPAFSKGLDVEDAQGPAGSTVVVSFVLESVSTVESFSICATFDETALTLGAITAVGPASSAVPSITVSPGGFCAEVAGISIPSGSLAQTVLTVEFQLGTTLGKTTVSIVDTLGLQSTYIGFSFGEQFDVSDGLTIGEGIVCIEIPELTQMTCTPGSCPGEVLVTWDAGGFPYDGFSVSVDGAVVATPTGGSDTATVTGTPGQSATVCVEGSSGGFTTPALCRITVPTELEPITLLDCSTQGSDQAEMSWLPGSGYDSITVTSDGVPVQTLPGDAVGTVVPGDPGDHEYCVVGVFGVFSTPPVCCDVTIPQGPVFALSLESQTADFDPLIGLVEVTVPIQLQQTIGAPTPIHGLSISLAHDETIINATAITEASPISALDPDFAGGAIVDGGVTFGVIFSFGGTTSLDVMTQTNIMAVTYSGCVSQLIGERDPVDVPLTWTPLGSPLVFNTVATDSEGTLVDAEGVDGGITLQPDLSPLFVRGNCNNDDTVNIADAIHALDSLFAAASCPCPRACDANEDGGFDIGDAIYFLSYLFAGGSAPSEPFPSCGIGAGEDSVLACDSAVCPPIDTGMSLTYRGENVKFVCPIPDLPVHAALLSAADPTQISLHFSCPTSPGLDCTVKPTADGWISAILPSQGSSWDLEVTATVGSVTPAAEIISMVQVAPTTPFDAVHSTAVVLAGPGGEAEAQACECCPGEPLFGSPTFAEPYAAQVSGEEFYSMVELNDLALVFVGDMGLQVAATLDHLTTENTHAHVGPAGPTHCSIERPTFTLGKTGVPYGLGCGVVPWMDSSYVVFEPSGGRIGIPSGQELQFTEAGGSYVLPRALNASLTVAAEYGIALLEYDHGGGMAFAIAPDGSKSPLAFTWDSTADNLTRIGRDCSGAPTKGGSSRDNRDDGTPNELTYEWVVDHELGVITSQTDILGATTNFIYNDDLYLTEVQYHPVETVGGVAAGDIVTDTQLGLALGGPGGPALINQPRTLTLLWDDAGRLAGVQDGRGETPFTVTYDGASDRVSTKTINDHPWKFFRDTAAIPVPSRPALVDPGNYVVSVCDPLGYVVDYEFHGVTGGPLIGPDSVGLGKFHVRRIAEYTKTGMGEPPLRAGEPEYYAQYFLHDCDCGAEIVRTESMPSDYPATFDPITGIPTNYPRLEFTYDPQVNVTALVKRGFDPSEQIRIEQDFQSYAKLSIVDGKIEVGQYSRMTALRLPRHFSSSPLYAGQSFEHTFTYDGEGRLLEHNFPDVTLASGAVQSGLFESSTYDDRGRLTSHTDARGNRTVLTYHTGAFAGGGFSTQGSFWGYPATVTRGAAGSTDPEASLTTQFQVNARGDVTGVTDPRGFQYDIVRNAYGEVERVIYPEVTLGDETTTASYEDVTYRDAAGHVVLQRRSNIDHEGNPVAGNEFIDTSFAYDAIGHVVAVQNEIDGDDNNDILTTFTFDDRESPVAVQKPEGNRVFMTYDERDLPFRLFYGVDSGVDPLQGYPATPYDEVTSSSIPFVGVERYDYDARRNGNATLDGRGFSSVAFFDFNDRPVATRDQNGNGARYQWDEGSFHTAVVEGEIDSLGDLVGSPLRRTYSRFDQWGRTNQTVLDLEPQSSEADMPDPAVATSSSYSTEFDAVSRPIQVIDANGNSTFVSWDAANRAVAVEDALGNQTVLTHNENSQVIRVDEHEVVPGGLIGSYGRAIHRDELDRVFRVAELGLNDVLLGHETRLFQDSLGFVRQSIDGEGRVDQMFRDDLARLTEQLRLDGVGGSVVRRTRHDFDKNSRRKGDRAYSDAVTPAGEQVTRRLFDSADRLVVTVHPDSDDVIDYSTQSAADGSDGLFDRELTEYDAINPILFTDQRGVEIGNIFDPANRLVEQLIALPTGVAGETRRIFDYDAVDRLTEATNDYARVTRAHDALNRVEVERQRLNPLGTGFTDGWKHQIKVQSSYDPQSNRTSIAVLNGGSSDLECVRDFDALNRVASISASYFGSPMHSIASYEYAGPGRVTTKSLGNGTELTRLYDSKRRPTAQLWNSGLGGQVVGALYGYDRVDNPIHRLMTHDSNLADNFDINSRDEVTGVNFRSASPTDYRMFGGGYTQTFTFDDVFNREAASFGDPFGLSVTVDSNYDVNEANEYTSIVRDGASLFLAHDAAGNMALFPVRPGDGPEAGNSVAANAVWDAFNRAVIIIAGGNAALIQRTDALGRRVAQLEVDGSAVDPGTAIVGGQRFVLDGWTVCEERTLAGTLGDWSDALERVYVNGRSIDEPLLCAIDGDGDGMLETEKNLPASTGGVDREFFYHCDVLGSVQAITDADLGARVLEYYRYGLFGDPVVLPVVDVDADGLEDTPGSLADNAAAGVARKSEFGNVYLFTARRWEPEAGVYYYRYRWYEPETGRFLGRDPLGESVNASNLYAMAWNNTVVFADPMGLDPVITPAEAIEGELAWLRDQIARYSKKFYFFGPPSFFYEWQARVMELEGTKEHYRCQMKKQANVVAAYMVALEALSTIGNPGSLVGRTGARATGQSVGRASGRGKTKAPGRAEGGAATRASKPLKFDATDLVYGPSAGGALRELQRTSGGKLLTDIPKPVGSSWVDHSLNTLKCQIKSGGNIRFDLTHMKDLAGALRGTGKYSGTVTSQELRFIRDNWENLFRGAVTFLKNGGEVAAPW